MTNSPNPSNEPERRTNPRSRKTWVWVGLGVGAVAFVGGVIGARQAWIFIHRDLAPLIEKNLSQTLNRPVELGEVEGFSLSGLSFGASALPPTKIDKDQVTIDSVSVRFNLIELLLTRTLRLSLTLENPNLFIDQDQDGAWIKIQPQTQEGEGPIKTELDVVSIENGTLVLLPSRRLTAKSGEPPGFQDTATRPRVTLQHINGDANFYDNNQRISFDVNGLPATGGNFRLRGEVLTTTKAVNLVAQGQDLLAQDISSLLPLPLALQSGRLAANLEIRFRPDAPLAFNGVARFRDVIATISGVPNRFSKANGELRFQEQTIALENVSALYGLIPARASGTIHTQNGYNLSAQVRGATVSALLKTFDLKLPVAASGTLNADLKLTGALDQPLITGNATNAGPVRVDRVDIAAVRTRFNVTTKALTFDQIEATPRAGGQVTGNGRLIFGDRGGLAFAFQGRNLPGDAIARPYGANSASFTLGRLAADVRVTGPVSNFQTVINWRAPGATYPGQGDIVIAGNVIRLQNTALRVAGGTVTATAEAVNGRWQAVVNASRVALSQFSQELRGLFSGDLRLSGRLDALNPAGVRAQGRVRFSEGISLVNRPTVADIVWNGERLLVQRATAPGFDANGSILAQLQGQGAPAITELDLNVNLRNYNISSLSLPIPQQVQVQGQTDFTGRITGSLAAINVAGQLGLNNFVVNNLAFERSLRGNFRYAGGRELNLDVSGREDRIAVRLDARNRPTSFLVRQAAQDILAQGNGRGDRLMATLQNFPLELLNIAPAAQVGLGRVGGRVNGTFDINLANLSNPSVVGTVAIARPAIGYINADSFTGQFSYSNGSGVLRNGELRRGESLYRIVGNFAQGTNPRFQGQIAADRGRIEDILTAVQWFDFQDFGRGVSTPNYNRANAVTPIAIDTFGDTVLNQLRRYSEIAALLDEQVTRREAESNFPDLADLKGSFSGNVDFSGSQQEGLTANFSLRGDNWTWDQFGVNQVIADGNFASGVLTLLPVRLQGITYNGTNPLGEDAFVAYSGTVGGAQQSGQLLVRNVPIAALRDLFALPIDLDGYLNANATLTGSQQNPQVEGEFNLANASLNGNEVQEARTIFGYNNARLNFNGRVVVAEPEPLRISGSIPYRFAFMDPTLDPGNQISLDVNVRNEGLGLLNLLTRNQLLWQSGEGDVQLQVRGTIYRPLATGIATFRNATFSAQALPEPITGVAGTVRFNRDRINVEALQGQFSNGQIAARGILPIFDADALSDALSDASDGTTANIPLTVDLQRLALNLKGIYNGGVNGQVVVTGTAFAPQIGGQIVVSNGRVLLPEGSQAAAAPGATNDTNQSLTTPPQFNNLLLTLGNNLLITRAPLLNFVATGDLTINGPFDDLRPNGTINLRRGQVNLFTTQFNLARGYQSTAVFTPERGLDPFIDVRLSTSVVEVTRAPVFQSASPFASSEVADAPIGDYGAFQTVRVQASVRGPASQIFDNLELSSSPRRTENEIIALLGGSFINTLGQGDGTLAIANLASSALLTSVQNFISNALGLSEFRLFPTTIIDEDERTSSFGLAAEAGVDITNDISVSALQILTDNVPTQFSLRYRLNQNFLLRGSSNFSGDSRAVLEFQTRF